MLPITAHTCMHSCDWKVTHPACSTSRRTHASCHSSCRVMAEAGTAASEALARRAIGQIGQTAGGSVVVHCGEREQSISFINTSISDAVSSIRESSNACDVLRNQDGADIASILSTRSFAWTYSSFDWREREDTWLGTCWYEGGSDCARDGRLTQ